MRLGLAYYQYAAADQSALWVLQWPLNQSDFGLYSKEHNFIESTTSSLEEFLIWLKHAAGFINANERITPKLSPKML